MARSAARPLPADAGAARRGEPRRRARRGRSAHGPLRQNILQTLAAGGLPPTISKYVSEYNATNQKENSYKLILVSIKIAILLGITFGLLMIFL